MRQRLAEAKTGVDHDALGGNTGGVRGAHARVEKRQHLGDHVVITRFILHLRGRALHVHQANCDLAWRDRCKRLRRLQRIDVVDHGSARCDRFAHERGFLRIDRNRHRPTRELLEQRQHAAAFLVERNAAGARPRRLPAQVENVGAFGDELARAVECGARGGKLAAIRK